MKCFGLATAIAGLAAAEWVDVPVRTPRDAWRGCETDADCDSEGTSCYDIMWKDSTGNVSSSRGCEPDDQCAGTATFNYRDGETVQYFCNEEQTEKGNAVRPLAWGTSTEKVWTEWKRVCETDSDCPEETQVCVAERWVFIEDGEDVAYSTGWGCQCNCAGLCPGDDWALEREEPEGKEYEEFSCDVDYAATFSSSVRGTSALTAMTAFVLLSAQALF